LFYSSVPTEAVTIAILISQLMLSYKHKVKSFKQCFYRRVCDVKSYNKCSSSSLSALTQPHNCFLPCR